MELNIYREIISVINKHEGLSMHCLKILEFRFPGISHQTLFSILSQECQRHMRMNHIKTPDTIDKYYKLYTKEVSQSGASPGVIIRLANRFQITPCLAAKLILQKYFEAKESLESVKINNAFVNKYLRDSSLIQDPKLAYEIYLCTLYDDQYSPFTEIMRSSIGQQHEIQLQRQLTELNLAFRDEEYLRSLGYDKTPDFKLDIPIAVDGFIINWIESKALFGDQASHNDYERNQYSSYTNRFGPGLIIYWYGYLSTIVKPHDKRFIIRDKLPIESIVQVTNKPVADLTINTSTA